MIFKNIFRKCKIDSNLAQKICESSLNGTFRMGNQGESLLWLAITNDATQAWFRGKDSQ